ncbi:LLM class oxidoreductase [Aquimarina litoralis]|uniref:LLM class oxidoreductase n=1 Tax=Aquimarina litoralis TaxID=584605 RepID=UPI001C59B6D5|nr:LLM class oxidoreductase [Aquimarina litoralis]MBW1297587.1 TIGR03571 family LLM class oxidoreductase [Aquimarina litoralis]
MKTLAKIARQGKLSLGLVFPLESYQGAIAKMENQEKLARRAEELGFKALWFRDVPFHDPSFGDAGQLYDPWIYMTHIMNHTKKIMLATGSIILPLRHPVNTAKSIYSLQNLSEGRIIIGAASGDRPIEYPAFNYKLSEKGELFRDSFQYIKALQNRFPIHQSKHYGMMDGRIDLLPKSEYTTPILVTGHSGQSLDWIAKNADGWLYYPRDFAFLTCTMSDWSHALKRNEQSWKPYMQSLYIDLLEDKNATPSGIHLGFKSGVSYTIEHLKALESAGVNHVIINLKYGSRPAEEVIEELGEHVVPHFI